MSGKLIAFPHDFAWGAATAAYQIEGAAKIDGRGESIWDRFSHTIGKVTNGDTGDVACDHYHRFADDIKIMKELGLKAYRFSISWPRVIPAGKGSINHAGLDFYDRLVDGLLENDIQPYLTLYHWDLPQGLQDLGGWENRDIGGYFADYAALMMKRLGDRVRFWATINEPWVIAHLGYRTGEMAPGVQSEKRALQVGHNLLVGHAQACQAIRAGDSRAKTGIVLCLWPSEPLTDSAEDQREAESAWQRDCGWFLSPLFRAHYPAERWKLCGRIAPEVKPGELEMISQPVDFLGVNYYSRNVQSKNGQVSKVEGSQYTQMGWEVHAPAFRRLLTRIARDYSLPPIYITENGAAYADVLDPDGQVHDPQRIDYLRQHLAEVREAINEGVDVKGYFVWSLMDNFEWAHGYSKRFGITYVDYPTQSRIIKDSGRWYSETIKQNGFEDPAP